MKKITEKPSVTIRDRLWMEVRMLKGLVKEELTHDQLVSKVCAYMLQKETQAWKMAYEEFLFSSGAEEGTAPFVPQNELMKDEKEAFKVLTRVQTMVITKEQELLEKAHVNASAYNILIVDAVMKLESGKPLSAGLAKFIANHLLSPKTFSQKTKGRPKRDPLTAERKFFAILYAISHGLTATRKSQDDRSSACDIVEAAARKLAKQGHSEFAHGYGYETLRKIHSNYPSL